MYSISITVPSTTQCCGNELQHEVKSKYSLQCESVHFRYLCLNGWFGHSFKCNFSVVTPWNNYLCWHIIAKYWGKIRGACFSQSFSINVFNNHGWLILYFCDVCSTAEDLPKGMLAWLAGFMSVGQHTEACTFCPWWLTWCVCVCLHCRTTHSWLQPVQSDPFGGPFWLHTTQLCSWRWVIVISRLYVEQLVKWTVDFLC